MKVEHHPNAGTIFHYGVAEFDEAKQLLKFLTLHTEHKGQGADHLYRALLDMGDEALILNLLHGTNRR